MDAIKIPGMFFCISWISVWNLFIRDSVHFVAFFVLFKILLAAMAAVSLRVPCLQEPVWSWERQGWEGMRSVWKET